MEKQLSKDRSWAAVKALPSKIWQESDQEPVGKSGLKPSMFVRVPNPAEYGKPENFEGYRDFWLGKVNTINPMANECQVLFEYYEADGSSHIIAAEYDLDDVSRINILPNTDVVLVDGRKS